MPDDPKPEPDKPLGGRGHKPTCECGTCQRIRHMHALGQAKPAHKRRIGPKQVRRKAFVKALTDPLSETFGSQGKSAQAAGYAQSTGNALMKDPQVQGMVRAALERHGIDDDYLVAGLKEGLRAEETKLATFEGKFTDERRVPDYRARARFQEMAHQLRRDFPEESETQGAQIVIQVSRGPLTPGHDLDCGCAQCVAAYENSLESYR